MILANKSVLSSRLDIQIALALFFWLLAFLPGITTAINVWAVSEIYNHCFIIIPGVLYLLHQKRLRIYEEYSGPSPIYLVPVAMLTAVQVFAQIGDIKVLMHIATFLSLPFLIISVIGSKAAKTALYPLSLIIFSIPIGDQLIPFLQELTTDLAVPLLELSNVPVYRNGLYLEIPEGKFLVAEACSGISFLITSIVFGFFYSYVSFSSIKKRLLFIALSVLIPIIANAIRVYGIILTGHLSNMEYAVGADHLIYGGVFFGIVLFILIGIGETFRDKAHSIKDTRKSSPTVPYSNALSLLLSLFTLFILQQIWLKQLNTPILSPINIHQQISAFPLNTQRANNWQPQLSNPTHELYGFLKEGKGNIFIHISYFNEQSSELISSRHRMFSDKYWSLSSSSNYLGLAKLSQLELVSQIGEKKSIAYAYIVGGRLFTSKTKAKLYQTYLRIVRNDFRGFLIAFDGATSLSNIEIIDNTVNELLLIL